MVKKVKATGGPGTRTRILDAAERLFAVHGFDGTATSLIAKVAAVPKGLLFYYFPVKKDILSSLVGERLGMGNIVAAPLVVPGNPVKALLNLSDKLFQLQAGSDVLRVILWREEHTHPEVRQYLAAHRRALHATIEQVLAGSLPVPVTPRRLAAAAHAWAAIVTARPLAEPPTEQTAALVGALAGVAVESSASSAGGSPSDSAAQGSAVQGADPSRAADDMRLDLASLAELLCFGLMHQEGSAAYE